VITGASSPEQVVANAKATGVTFDPETWKKAEGILGEDTA
jgi:aryl-alcohol dehydrogenase-like predicted oxidoreductase